MSVFTTEHPSEASNFVKMVKKAMDRKELQIIKLYSEGKSYKEICWLTGVKSFEKVRYTLAKYEIPRDRRLTARTPMSETIRHRAWREIKANPGGLTTSEMAERLGITMKQASSVISRWVAYGHVERRRDMPFGKTIYCIGGQNK